MRRWISAINDGDVKASTVYDPTFEMTEAAELPARRAW
jgi:hypothetical protein